MGFTPPNFKPQLISHISIGASSNFRCDLSYTVSHLPKSLGHLRSSEMVLDDYFRQFSYSEEFSNRLRHLNA